MDGDTLTYAWSITNRPAGSQALPSDAAAVMPGFVVDTYGTYVVQLIVKDGQVNSAPHTTTIEAVRDIIDVGVVDAGVIDDGADSNNGSGSGGGCTIKSGNATCHDDLGWLLLILFPFVAYFREKVLRIK